MTGIDIDVPSRTFTPFPDAVDVFWSRPETHAKYLLPAGTLSLNQLSPNWEGLIHFVLPIEPVGGFGYLAENSTPYHNYYCRPNWFAYSLRDSKAEFHADFRYFHSAYYAAHPPLDVCRQEELAILSSHYENAQHQFQTGRTYFRDHGALALFGRRFFARNVGGSSLGAQWANTTGFPISRYSNRELPRTEDGRDFVFVGEVEMWNYVPDSNGVLIVFYDHKEKLVLSTIDWS